jgi:SAM-dependent methyltransferase
MNEREYDIMYTAEESHWWYLALHEFITGFVAVEASRGRLDILDAGCGTGRLCQLMEPYGRVTGCDFSDRAIALCRKRGLERVFRADLNTADLGTEQYHVITSIDVLYHRAIGDDAPVLASFYRALKPGGLLILNLVAYEFLRSTHDVAVHTRKRYTMGELLPVLTAAGFTVERATYRLGLLFPPIFLMRLVKRLLPSPPDERLVDSDVSLPHPLLNRLLLAGMRAENRFLRNFSLPCGTSLFVVARKSGIAVHDGAPEVSGNEQFVYGVRSQGMV